LSYVITEMAAMLNTLFFPQANGLKGLGHPVSAGMGQEVHIA
jgi:hypothetical protein